MNEENNLIGKRIKMLRQGNNLTQAELATMLGVQFSAVNKWESGTVKNIKQSTIRKMADIFKVSPAYLMGFADLNTENNPEETYLLNKYRSMATPQQRRLLAYLMGFCKGADLDKEDPS